MARAANAAVQIRPAKRVSRAGRMSQKDRSPKISSTVTSSKETSPAVFPPTAALSSSSWSSATEPVSRTLTLPRAPLDPSTIESIAPAILRISANAAVPGDSDPLSMAALTRIVCRCPPSIDTSSRQDSPCNGSPILRKSRPIASSSLPSCRANVMTSNMPARFGCWASVASKGSAFASRSPSSDRSSALL